MHLFGRRTDAHGIARSEFSELPTLLEQPDHSAHRHWFVLTGGLALLLSRTPSAAIAARFPATYALYLLLRRRAAKACAEANLELLDEVRHEIASVADPLTRTSLQACFQACARQDRGNASGPESGVSGWRSSAPHAQSSLFSRRRLPPGVQDDAPTQLNPDLLAERSSALREKVAAARGSFADLK